MCSAVDLHAGVPGRGWRGWGAWHARALSACAGVDVRRCLACIGLACTGDEGVARMWIGYADVDRLITYPDVDNLSACGVASAGSCKRASANAQSASRTVT